MGARPIAQGVFGGRLLLTSPLGAFEIIKPRQRGEISRSAHSTVMLMRRWQHAIVHLNF